MVHHRRGGERVGGAVEHRGQAGGGFDSRQGEPLPGPWTLGPPNSSPCLEGSTWWCSGICGRSRPWGPPV
eukprot:9487613-Pyramimonas_sp.AAC.1